MDKGQEVELKLEIDPGAADALHSHALLASAQAKRVAQVSTYYDTGKGAIRGAGYSLRVRQAGSRFVQTVKQDAGDAAGLFDRPEWESEIAAAEVDLGALAGTPLASLLAKRRKSLRPVVTSEVERTVWLLRDNGTEIEIILDTGTIAAGKRSAPLSEIEIELKRGRADDLMALARTLARDLPVRIGVMTKAERGFALADGALGKVAKAEPVRVDASMSVAAGFAAIAGACLRHFRLNEPAVTARRDPSALHQARVAMRRLRSAFSLFAPVIADAEFERLREELRWFTGELGEARNLDVFLKRLPSDRRLASLRRGLEERREAAYDRVLEALAAPRHRALMIDLVAWTATGAWRAAPEAAAPLAHFASDRLDRRWKKVKKTGRALAALDPEPRHRLRIDVKKLRYATEFLAGLYPGRTRAFTAALEDMQEALGELNDMETASELLAGLPAEEAEKAVLNSAALTADQAEARAVKLLAQAQNAHADLVEAGPYWR